MSKKSREKLRRRGRQLVEELTNSKDMDGRTFYEKTCEARSIGRKLKRKY